MMMGKESEARAEFAEAIASSGTSADRLTWKTSAALTYLYEGKKNDFLDGLRAVAAEAHEQHLGVQEAQAFRYLAMCSATAAGMMHYDSKAEAVLSGITNMMPSDNNEQLAAILRTEAIHTARPGTQGASNEALEELRLLALNTQSIFAQMTNEGAIGGVLFAQKQYTAAIAHLQEDQYEPLSMARLAIAYRITGQHANARSQMERLKVYRQPTLSDFLARRLLATYYHPKSAHWSHAAAK